MSNTGDGIHPFARLDTEPNKQEVEDAMQAVPGFDDLMDKITQSVKVYKVLIQERYNFAFEASYDTVMQDTGENSNMVTAEGEDIDNKLKGVNKYGKSLVGQYLSMFFKEYMKYKGDKLRMWSFPKVMWQHFKDMVSRLFDYPRQDFPSNEGVATHSLVPFGHWDNWVKEQDAIPPFLKIVDTNPTFSQGINYQEWEMLKVNGDRELIQEIYTVCCGPRLCGTKASDGLRCDHLNHIHQFTKRPLEWERGTGWSNGNPYGTSHLATAFGALWQPIFESSDPAGPVLMDPKRDHDDSEFYEDLYRSNSGRWLSKTPAEASVSLNL